MKTKKLTHLIKPVRSNFCVWILSFAFFVFSFDFVSAAVPRLITYQGLLKDSSGNLLTGTYSMTFKIYSAPAGGTPLWLETQSSVSVSSGKFSVQLGAVTALNLSFSADYWLGIAVGADGEMTPRVKLTSVGYAYMAEQVVNGFNQAQHDALSHKNIEGVRDNTVHIAKTNFKLDAYSLATANGMGDLIIDTFNDATGIHAVSSTNSTWRGSTNYDVVVTPAGGGVIQSSPTENDLAEFISNIAVSAKGVGQQFQHGSQVTVDKVAFKWSKVGSPTGNVRIRIYTDTSGLPGTLLGESGDIAVSGISAVYPSYEEFTATLTAAVTLSANTPYHGVLEATTATGDGTHHVNVRAHNGNPYAGGVSVSKNSSNAWQTYSSAADFYFKVYEQAQPLGTADVRSIAYSESSVPAEAMVIADETLGTGSITYYVSRDNGTAWTQVAKETVASLSSQPSGTQLKWKAVITGNAELNAIAVAV